MIGYIYIIRNAVNNLVYVGLTTSTIAKRWGRHKSDMKYSDAFFYREMRKIGFESFSIEILEKCEATTKKLLIIKLGHLEEKWIGIHKSNDIRYGYNQTSGGGAGVHCQQAILEKSKKMQPLSDHENNKKFCPNCECVKDYSAFCKNKSASFGIGGYCNECRKKMRKVPPEEFHYQGKLLNNENEKYCNMCKKVKPKSEFYKRNYRIAYCMVCLRAKAKKEHHEKRLG